MLELSAKEQAVAADKARNDFYFYARYMFYLRRGYQWRRARHHQLTCDALTRVYLGLCKRLIITMPPRYSKTELAVINWISWCLGKVPDAEFIHPSYSAMLAEVNSAKTRDLVDHETYQKIFPGTVLATEGQAHWKTTAGGVMYAAGAGGTITGFGAGKMRPGFAGAIVIDDPHKADEARSEKIRKGVIEWFQETLESRKNSPDTPIILIMQRLHEEDLAGWLLGGGNGEAWEHLCLPAIQDDGTALWPEKHSIEQLRVMQRASPYMFAGQYQQAPAPPEGNIFLPDMMPICAAVPVGTRFVRGWDLASVEEDGDWTVGAKIGLKPDGSWVIADIVRFQGRPEQVEAALKNTADADGKSVRVSIPQDPGQAGKAQVAAITKLLNGFAVESSPESGDKITRAEPFAAQVNVGNVSMVSAEWNESLKSEMRIFPNGVYDDQVDACARSFNAKRPAPGKVQPLRI